MTKEITKEEYLAALQVVKQYKLEEEVRKYEEKKLKLKNFLLSVKHINVDLLKSNLSTRAKTVLKREFEKPEVYVADVAAEILKHDLNPIIRYRDIGRKTRDEIMNYVSPFLIKYNEFKKNLET